MPRESKPGERGQALMMATFSMVALFGVMGFSVDLGHFYYRKQVAQAAADAGALAAAAYANDNSSTAELVVTAVACGNAAITAGSAPYVGCQYAEAASNGSYPASDISMTSGKSVPTQAPGTPSTYWVQTTVSESLNSTFLRFFGHNSVTVSAEATAGIVGGSTGTPYCMMALSTTAAEAFFASGSTSGPKLTNCGIDVNSSANSSSSPNSNAYVLNGSANVTLSGSGGKVTVHGGANVNGTYCGTTGVTCSAAVVTDPLINLQPPSNAGAACPTSGTGSVQYNFSNGTATINPGIYCGGINVSGGTLTLNPGTYILRGGGLTIDSASAVVTGSGVTFYNTGTSSTVEPVTISGQPNVTLSAPTSGQFQGILIFQDRSLTYTTNNQINGESSPNLTGTLYFPGSSVLFTGTNSTTPAYTAIIAQTITFNGGANFQWDSTGKYTGLASGSTANLLQ